MMNDDKPYAGPPRGTPPAEVWASLTEQPRPTRIVEFPRRQPNGEPICTVQLWILTTAEHALCAKASRDYAAKLGITPDSSDMAYDSVYTNAVTTEILARATRHPDDVTKKFFPSAEAIRQHLTTDEVAVLMKAYLDFQADSGPIISAMTSEEMDSWLDMLARGGEALDPFASLSSGAANQLLRHSARALSELRTASSSRGSQPDEPLIESTSSEEA